MTKKAIDTDKFISMWNAGAPISDMARHFGYSAGGAVSARASRMGLKPRHDIEANKTRDMAMFNAHLEGVLGRVIAKRFGVSQSFVSKVIIQMTARYPNRVDPPPDGTRILAWSASPAAIAKALAKHQGLRA